MTESAGRFCNMSSVTFSGSSIFTIFSLTIWSSLSLAIDITSGI
ncbi:hypothetical protein E2C01_070962 [Portunus trituberculatus]|uniref:Uncharacterized protein n=1 Tax=Portunus trituberculatus TaxID=210409 RepID=A0A5B7I3M0_PORTR|nr:hypothetical protein [Portunus trituberculatus]